jgi:predicted GTPase
MRITDIRETSVALKSSLRNAVFDFSEMTTSVVAVITDVVRDGKPVAGFADDAKVDNGYLKLSDRPGIGFEGQNALYAVMRELTA